MIVLDVGEARNGGCRILVSSESFSYVFLFFASWEVVVVHPTDLSVSLNRHCYLFTFSGPLRCFLCGACWIGLDLVLVRDIWISIIEAPILFFVLEGNCPGVFTNLGKFLVDSSVSCIAFPRE